MIDEHHVKIRLRLDGPCFSKENSGLSLVYADFICKKVKVSLGTERVLERKTAPTVFDLKISSFRLRSNDKELPSDK